MPGRFPRERKRERMAKGRVVYHKQPPAGAPRSISTTGARRRYYAITELGRELYRENRADWQKVKAIIDNLLQGEEEP